MLTANKCRHHCCRLWTLQISDLFQFLSVVSQNVVWQKKNVWTFCGWRGQQGFSNIKAHHTHAGVTWLWTTVKKYRNYYLLFRFLTGDKALKVCCCPIWRNRGIIFLILICLNVEELKNFYWTAKFYIVEMLLSYIHSSRVKLMKMFICSSCSSRNDALRWWLSCTDRSL